VQRLKVLGPSRSGPGPERGWETLGGLWERGPSDAVGAGRGEKRALRAKPKKGSLF